VNSLPAGLVSSLGPVYSPFFYGPDFPKKPGSFFPPFYLAFLHLLVNSFFRTKLEQPSYSEPFAGSQFSDPRPILPLLALFPHFFPLRFASTAFFEFPLRARFFPCLNFPPSLFFFFGVCCTLIETSKNPNEAYRSRGFFLHSMPSSFSLWDSCNYIEPELLLSINFCSKGVTLLHSRI